MLKRQGLIEPWHDRRITAGENLGEEIDKNLARADVVLCLVSPDFLASDYCYSREMARALERDRTGAARVVPIILRHCDWHQSPLGKLLATPRDGKPVMAWADRDEAFNNVTSDIRSALEKLGKAPTPKRSDERSSNSEVIIEPKPRSANLQTKKAFSDLERDQFLEASFEFIAEFFANSMRELNQRTPAIVGKFTRLDAHRFTASLYRDGKKQSGFTVFRGGMRGFGNDISFSNSDSGETNSSNGGFSLRDMDGVLGFSQLFGFGSSRDHPTSQLDVAEELWAKFIEPLQR